MSESSNKNDDKLKLAGQVYEFGAFRLVPAERQLLRDGQPISLPPKAFDTLIMLVQNHGHALKKDDLIEQVWPDSFVEESNLNHYISVLRKTLSNGQSGEDCVETVRGYGFRFNADVREVHNQVEELLVHSRTRTHIVVKEEEIRDSEHREHTQTALGRGGMLRPVVISALVSFLVIGAMMVAYFGYVRPAQLRGANSTSTLASVRRDKAAENPAAREAYLKGRYFWNKRTNADVLKAQFAFSQALTIDPHYAPAYAGLADCMLMGGAVPGATSAKDLALMALSIDDTLAEAHASLAYYISAVDWDWSGAELEFQKAISFDPQYATAHHWHAYNLAALGRLNEAVSEIHKAESLDPLSIIIKTDVGHMLYFSQRYDEAISQYLKALEMDPTFRVAHWRLGEAYIQVRRYEEALSELTKGIDLDSNENSEIEVWLACAYAAANNRQTSSDDS